MSAQVAVKASRPTFVSIVEFVASCKESIEYELEPFLMSRSFTLITGPQKQGKTFFAAWLVSELSAKGKVSLFVEEEGPAEILRDQFAPFIGHEWEKHEGMLFVSHRRGFRLDDPRKVDALIDHAKGVGASVIILDPADKVHGRDENKSTGPDGISDLVCEIQRIIVATGCVVVVLHHNKKPKGLRGEYEEAQSSDVRGSGAWTAGADSVIQIHGIPKSERRPGVLRFYVENSDSRVVPFDRKIAVVTMPQDGQPGGMKFLEPESMGAKVWRTEIAQHVPEAPEYATLKEIREASGIGQSRVLSAITFATRTGLAVRKPGKGGGIQRKERGLVRESPRESAS